jgi:hypothetical protein
MSRSERRHMHSYGLKIPLIFSPMNSPSANGLQAKSMNMSWGGVKPLDANDSTFDAAHNRGLPNRYPSIDARLVLAAYGGCS